jgi:dipeptidyl aminopeptidase/acylaminoacyl peptidase
MSFLGEIKRRKVFQVAAVYSVVAWLVVQVITSVEAPLNLPDWVDTFVIVLLAVGFPVALVLSWAFDVTPEGIRPARTAERDSVSSGPTASTFTYVSQGLVLIAVGFLVVSQYQLGLGSRGSSQPAATEVIRYKYGLAEAEQLVPTNGVSISVSPDGARIVYVGPAESGRQLWIRERDQLRSTPLPGSEGALQPFFAPDGRGVGFVTENRQLRVISRIGDPPLTLVDGGLYRLGATWGTDGQVYFSTAAGLMRQPATGGGASESVVPADTASLEVVGYAWPELLPNGKGALFTIIKNHLASDIAVVDFSTGHIRVLVEGDLGRYAESGHLIYVRENGELMAAPFDQDKLELSGPAVLLGDQLPAGTYPDLALSKTGRLLYATRPRRTLEVVWVDRDGNWTPVDPDNPMRGIRYATLSPDNKTLAITTWPRPPSDDGHIWIKKLPRGPFSQFTFEGIVNMRPSWSPDGESVIFISDRGENRDVWMKRVDGTREAEVLLDDLAAIDEAFYSSSGEWILHRRGMEDSERDIFAIRANGDTAATPLAASNFDEVAPALSADGRWLAYVSDRAGQANVYVRPFPEADTEIQVSANGGTEPVWARNQPELYYRNGSDEIVAVPLLPGDKFVTGTEQVLFSATAYRRDFYHAAYDVSADGERFVMIRISDSGSLDEELIAVENWFEELKRLVPIN